MIGLNLICYQFIYSMCNVIWYLSQDGLDRMYWSFISWECEIMCWFVHIELCDIHIHGSVDLMEPLVISELVNLDWICVGFVNY